MGGGSSKTVGNVIFDKKLTERNGKIITKITKYKVSWNLRQVDHIEEGGGLRSSIVLVVYRAEKSFLIYRLCQSILKFYFQLILYVHENLVWNLILHQSI